MKQRHFGLKNLFALFCLLLFTGQNAFASEADLKLPALNTTFDLFGNDVTGTTLFWGGLVISIFGVIFGMIQYSKVQALPAHESMKEVADLIYETCKTYLTKQGYFLIVLWVLVAACMGFYFGWLQSMGLWKTLFILAWSLVGMLGSYGVAWFGIRMNTLANARTSFASLTGKPFSVYSIPLQSGMSIGLLLVSVELIIMLLIFLLVDPAAAGACFIGFAIGESLGASVLRICGGIFTKIADIGSDLMKIVFNIKEDDARNPGVIADCTGDNAGDSVGPTADGFETYGVTGVALIVFICLAVPIEHQANFIVWLFIMRCLMILTSLIAYWINDMSASEKYKDADDMDFEEPLTWLVWLSSILAIVATFGASYLLLAQTYGDLWWKLAVIISCGTLAAAIIPELTKAFTSASSTHVKEVVNASREGGASLNILSGMVAGNFSAFWMGIVLIALMAIAWGTSTLGLGQYMGAHYPIFAFGLVAFGLLGMGPVTIAVDSYGPVTDNAQSVYELSLIEQIPGIEKKIKDEYGFEPDFSTAKHNLEKNDGAGNTFKATAKPVLIGTAVIGATAMIFSIIMMLEHTYGADVLSQNLSLLAPQNLLGFIAGGAVIYWFCGASMQAVTTGAYRAVEYIKSHIKLDSGCSKASVKDTTEVVAICTKYAQEGMINIFIVIFLLALGFACFNPYFFISYLISIALFGLFAAVYMANAGGSWDNAKKVVEVDLKEKGTPLHEASVVGDTVGDPYKDTSSVSLNPIIKFTTLFGLLAVEIAISPKFEALAPYFGAVLFIIALFFVHRSFYGMRIKSNDDDEPETKTEDPYKTRIEEKPKVSEPKAEVKKETKEELTEESKEKPKEESKKEEPKDESKEEPKETVTEKSEKEPEESKPEEKAEANTENKNEEKRNEFSGKKKKRHR